MHLSGIDRKLWRLQQDILFKWATFCVFKYRTYNCVNQTRGLIQFFVPADASHRYEIVEYLESELERERQEPIELPDLDYKCPGTEIKVLVHTFSGITPYIDRDAVDELAAQAYQYLVAVVKRQARKQEAAKDTDILQPVYAALRGALRHIEWKYFNGDTPLFTQRDPKALKQNLERAFETIEALRDKDSRDAGN